MSGKKRARMAYYEDLGRCDYFGYLAPAGELLAVGWLDHIHPISTGDVPPEVMARLLDFLREPWDLGNFWGSHLCEICRPEGIKLGRNPSREEVAEELNREARQFSEVPGLGIDNLFIPVPGSPDVYVAPSLIVHYIRYHQYCPPIQFQEALMKCPEMNSPAYLGHMRSRGLSKQGR